MKDCKKFIFKYELKLVKMEKGWEVDGRKTPKNKVVYKGCVWGSGGIVGIECQIWGEKWGRVGNLI